MKNTSTLCAIAALTLAMGSAAFAQQDKDVRTGTPALQQQRRDIQRADRNAERPRGGPPQRGDNRGPGRGPDRGYAPGRGGYAQDRSPGWQRGDRGPGWRGPGDRSYYRGDRLPPQYRGRQYVVDDWRGHHLNAPPRGYQWVQSGGDYLLIAITTGIIASILLNQ